MATAARIFTARVAQECEHAAGALVALQEALALHLRGDLDEPLMRDMQALDEVQQTLADLGTLFVQLSEHQADDHPPVPHKILKSVRQATLRARLSGHVSERSDNRLDLF